MALRCCIRSIAKQPQIILLVKYRMTHPYNLVGCILVVWLFTYSWLNPSSLTPHSSQWPHPAPLQWSRYKKTLAALQRLQIFGLQGLVTVLFQAVSTMLTIHGSAKVKRPHLIYGHSSHNRNPYNGLYESLFMDWWPSLSISVYMYVCMYIYIHMIHSNLSFDYITNMGHPRGKKISNKWLVMFSGNFAFRNTDW